MQTSGQAREEDAASVPRYADEMSASSQVPAEKGRSGCGPTASAPIPPPRTECSLPLAFHVYPAGSVAPGSSPPDPSLGRYGPTPRHPRHGGRRPAAILLPHSSRAIGTQHTEHRYIFSSSTR